MHATVLYECDVVGGMWLVAALLLSAAHHSLESSKSEGSSKLIQTLRKQLTRDNSDYSHETHKQNIKVHMRADPELDEKNTEHNNYYVTTINQLTNNKENSNIKDTAEENGSKKKLEHPVSEKDLFYYVDDEKLISKKPEDRKYKTIKVRHQYRRSGQSQYIQEEAEGGVAIVSLSKAPFPELRLPRSRRQYQHDHGAAATDDEDVPPPPAGDNKPPGERGAAKASGTGDQEDTGDVEKSTATVRQKDDERNVTLKSIDFVDVLKQDLRRNNDDYAEMEKNKMNFNTSSLVATTSESLLKYAKEITVEDTKNNISGFNRRADGGNSWEFDYDEAKTVPSTVVKKIDSPVTVTKEPLRKHKNKKLTTSKIHHTKRNTSRLKTPNEINLPKINSTTKAVKSIPKLKEVISKKKIDKFKKFVSKNKELFKGLLSSKPETRKDKVELKTQTNKVKLEVDNILREMRIKVKEAERAGEDEEDKLPNPNELDMAPAKGGRIHRLRAKGRLCHRHVLLPEGPKYDSGGRWYVPEHRAAARREYDATPRPRLLLPRCCNCCKKSVLGCQ